MRTGSMWAGIWARIWTRLLAPLAWSIPACAALASDGGATVRVPASELPHFRDDMQFAGLPEALSRQLAAAPTDEKVELGGVEYSAEHVRRSGERLRELVHSAQACLSGASHGQASERCFAEFRDAISSEFAVYTTRSPARFTAYYTPTIDVRREPGSEFRFPIYGLPDARRLRRLSRRAIDFKGALAGRQLELFYARSRFDIYLVHVEGGGRMRIHSDAAPTRAYLTYAGDNGRRFRPIEEYMVRRKMLGRNDVSRFAQREYLRAHPQDAERIFASCPWFVFFRETQDPVLGSAGVSLTDARSLASDPAHYPVKGLVAFVAAPAPLLPARAVPLESNPADVQFREITRFFVDQDEGPYIKGSARFDLFFGEDDYAKFLASNLRTQGRVWFLVLEERAGQG